MPIDQEARNMARQALARMDAHEQVCAERWGSSMNTMRDIKRILAWGTTALIGSMGTVILLLLNRTH